MTGRARLRLGLLVILFGTACASQRSAPPVSRPIPPGALDSQWSEEGLASWYGGGDGFDGKPTASGEIFDTSRLTAAHRDLPLGTIVDVTNVDNGKTVRVRVNDRGPFIRGRIIDLSRAAAREIDLIGPGVAPVRLRVVSEGTVVDRVEPAEPSGAWAVQVGSFGERERADRHVERLTGAGFTAYLEPYGGLTRVKVGPLDSRAEAESKLQSLEEAGFEGIVVAANP